MKNQLSKMLENRDRKELKDDIDDIHKEWKRTISSVDSRLPSYESVEERVKKRLGMSVAIYWSFIHFLT